MAEPPPSTTRTTTERILKIPPPPSPFPAQNVGGGGTHPRSAIHGTCHSIVSSAVNKVERVSLNQAKRCGSLRVCPPLTRRPPCRSAVCRRPPACAWDELICFNGGTNPARCPRCHISGYGRGRRSSARSPFSFQDQDCFLVVAWPRRRCLLPEAKPTGLVEAMCVRLIHLPEALG